MGKERYKKRVDMKEARKVTIKGIVQGVGFRPFVYRVAQEESIAGWVLNDKEGVLVHAEAEPDALDAFIIRLSQEEPEAARVTQIDIADAQVQGFTAFSIQFSDSSEVENTTFISPDLGTCAQCEAELFDPSNRRYRYPFINCTNCGPRFTILEELPYDRAHTSMRSFTMCPHCQSEYDDPMDRRFHAQPDACFECGPQLGWITSAQLCEGNNDAVIQYARNREESDEILARAVDMLKAGKIVAVKGLGGYHLVCDATNEAALATLRKRKRRPHKPFAVMVPSVEYARELCEVSCDEEAHLKSTARPIVLLRKKPAAHFATGLADNVPELGVMMASTPVQMLLAHDFGGMLVMTSGNVHNDPICITEHEAFEQLGSIADAFVVNNREIVARYDDSVMRLMHVHDAGYDGSVAEEGSETAEGSTMVQFMRRARGYAPRALEIACPDNCATAASSAHSASSVHTLCAVGPQQKSTFTLVRQQNPGLFEAFVSQHIGDVEHAAILDAWTEARCRYETLFQIKPHAMVCDMHPDYLLSKQARQQCESTPHMPLVEVQHHYAHIVSVMAENKLPAPVLGFAFDGTGYGPDGAIWGGEVLAANYETYERLANIAYFPLPGGAAAVKDPRRSAYGMLWAYDLLEHPAAQRFIDTFEPQLTETLMLQVERGINTPLTSSMGRLFDAVAALLGICERASYDGQPACMLENALHEGIATGQTRAYCIEHPECNAPYEFALIKNAATQGSTAQETSMVLIDPEPAIRALLDDYAAAVPVGVIAKRFHDGIIESMVLLAQLFSHIMPSENGALTVALSGGVFQNRYLCEHAIESLCAAGCAVALNLELPPNDGNISYGQAVVGLHQFVSAKQTEGHEKE